MKKLLKGILHNVAEYAYEAMGGMSAFVLFAVNNDPNTMIGDFKNLYQDMGLVNAVPNWMIIQERFKFQEAQAGLGQFYIFGVILQKEQGFTYAPSSGANSGVQTLLPSVAGYIGSAQIQGFAREYGALAA